MHFAYPELLVLLPIVFFIWLWARRPRQWVDIPDRRQAKKSGFLSRLILASPLLCWLAVLSIIIIIMAEPKTTFEKTFITIEKKILVVSVDTSSSMGTGLSSAMEKIKLMVIDFVRLREGDVIGISAYGGERPKNRGRGYARSIMYPTDDLAQVETAVRSIESQMFGLYTAIGDGVFVSTLALIEQDLKKQMGDRYDRVLLEASVDSLETAEEDLSYAQEAADSIGPQKGKFILLFTDGKYNTGMHPAKAIWFAHRLGIRVHFIAFASTGPTGLNADDQIKHKLETIQAVLESGGTYKESDSIDGVAKLFAEVDVAEKSKFVVEGELKEVSQNDSWVIAMALIFLVWITVENFWIKVP